MDDAGLQAGASDWIAAFEAALAVKDADRLSELFCDPAYLRDNGALTWDYRQFHGRDAVVAMLLSVVDAISPHDFMVSQSWPAPRVIGEDAAAVIEAFFDFRTATGTGILLLHAVPSEGDPTHAIKARAVFTRLEDLDAIERPAPYPAGRGYTPNLPGETWKQQRDAARRYDQGQPDVMVIGAGQAGVVTAAHLRRFGVNVLNIDRYEKVGDSWNKRYESLSLHNPIEMNGFPYLPFPPHYPQYLSKDLLGDWLDIYARYMT